MLATIFIKLKSKLGIIRALVGSFIMSAGWNWYHTPYRPHGRFVLLALLTWVAVFVGYFIFKWVYHFFTAKFNRHVFWQKDFGNFLDKLFLFFSLFFLVFFSRNQLASVGLFFCLMGLFFYKTQDYLSHHPNAQYWKIVNKNIFIIIFFLFSLFSVVQYAAFRMVNFDSYIKFHNIVLFRAWAMTMFFVLGFVIATLIFFKIKSKWRYVALGLWGALFIALVFLWVANIAIMYFSGLYLSPLMLLVAQDSAQVSFNSFSSLVIFGGLVVLVLFGLVYRQVIRSFHTAASRQWTYYSLALIAVSLGSLFGLSSFQNTPEYTIARNFYQFFLGKEEQVDLNPVIQEKLEKFGLFYNTDEFYLAHKDAVFSSGTPFLSGKFAANKPNIIIIFFESFSSNLTSVYNKNFPNLTPGLERMAADTSTIVFKNYYNASTPTINGIIAQLCSFLPPIGYTEIEVDKNLQRLRLLCLPTVLKNNGYKSTTYITAVKKEFENKNAIFTSMDTDHIYGQDELKNIINGEPLSWGYSDHQLFPAMWKLVGTQSQEPFVMMLSTVDTHPPFDLAKDMVNYEDGKNNVLNSYHTADDAFAQFWQDFTQSPYYNNTVVIAVADHSAFPGAEVKKIVSGAGQGLSFYDENMFMMYLPGVLTSALSKAEPEVLPKEINLYSSSIDVVPTLLQILNINVPNGFEGHSLFDDKNKYPNVLGMHEYGLYINQDTKGARDIRYEIPSDLKCGEQISLVSASSPLTLCEYLEFYRWKRQLFEQGRFWGK